MKRLVNIVFLLAIHANAAETKAPLLTLDQFLSSVQEQNQGFKASKAGEEAAKLIASEAQLIYSPALFSTLQFIEDGKKSFIPTFNYEKIVTQSYTLGISQQTSFGLQGKLYYNLTETEYKGLMPAYSEGRPTLELSQSLWRNDFGRETRAQVTAGFAEAKGAQYREGFERQSQLAQAEVAYWRLALARQSDEFAKENLARADRIFAWAKRRVNLSLADRSDLLTATTALEGRKLEAKVASAELRSAALAFNNARGIQLDQVSESLEPLSKELIDRLKISERRGDRQDVLAITQQSEALKAKAIAGRERNQPNLELFGSYSFNSRESSQSRALNESWSNDRPTEMVGLRFSTPLSFGRLGDVQEGYGQQAIAAEQKIERQRFLQEQDWRDLVQRFQEAKERLAAAEDLEKHQREKLSYERDRQERGRSTLFQVITYESDYSNAQAMRLKILAELLQIAAQMKLYGVN